MGGQFDDTWLDDSVESTGDEFIPTDPFEGLTKRDQDLFFKMLYIVPDDKREQAMEYFVDHPKKIREIIAVIKLKRKLIEDRNLENLQAIFAEHRVQFETTDNTAGDEDDELLEESNSESTAEDSAAA